MGVCCNWLTGGVNFICNLVINSQVVGDVVWAMWIEILVLNYSVKFSYFPF